jgi:hypothetical protein
LDSSASEDSADEDEDEVDELEPTDSEAELEHSESLEPGAKPEEAPVSRGLTRDRISMLMPKTDIEGQSHGDIRNIDIEACIDPATGITEEDVKEAMDAVREQEREQDQQQAETDSAVAHGSGHSVLTSAERSLKGPVAGIDHDLESPFLSEMVVSSSSTSTSTLVNGENEAVRSSGDHSRREHAGASRHGGGGFQDMHPSPGLRGRMRRDCHSASPSPSLLEDPRGNPQHDHDERDYDHQRLQIPQRLRHTHHQHHRRSRDHSTGRGGFSEDESIDIRGSTGPDRDSGLNGNMDVDMKVAYDDDDSMSVGGSGGKALNSEINDSELNDHRSHDDNDDDAYGPPGHHRPPSLDRSLSPLDSHRPRNLHQHSNDIMDEDEPGVDERMLHHPSEWSFFLLSFSMI